MLEEERKETETPPATASEIRAKYNTGDTIRDKCIEMLVTALCTDTPERNPRICIF